MLPLAVRTRGVKEEASTPSVAYGGLKLALCRSEAPVVSQAVPQYGIIYSGFVASSLR